MLQEDGFPRYHLNCSPVRESLSRARKLCPASVTGSSRRRLLATAFGAKLTEVIRRSALAGSHRRRLSVKTLSERLLIPLIAFLLCKDFITLKRPCQDFFNILLKNAVFLRFLKMRKAPISFCFFFQRTQAFPSGGLPRAILNGRA